MEKEISSYSSQRKSALKVLLILDSSQILSNFIIGILFMVIINVPSVWISLTSESTMTSTQYLGQLFNDYAPWLYNTYNDIAHGRAVQMLLWLLVGCLSYLIIWFFGSFFTSLRNDVVADSYVHPRSYNRSSFWLSVISRKIIFVFLSTILIVYIPIAIGYLVQLSAISYDAIIHFQPLNSLPNLAASAVTAAVLIHIFFILLRSVTNNWKVIYNDL